jgi:heat shock protein HspQ
MISNQANNEQANVMHNEAKFDLGQLVTHKLFDYRGVVVDIDPVFLGTDTWYEKMAKSMPPKDKPWYRVLVNNSLQETYVAEQNLQVDQSREGINHPQVKDYFDQFSDGHYKNSSRRPN